MTTSSRASRVLDSVLDPDYLLEDEQERARRHQALAMAASLQWVLSDWVLAALAWRGNQQLAYGVVTVAVLVWLPSLLSRGRMHLLRQWQPMRRTRWWRVMWILTVPSYILIGAGYYYHHGGEGQWLSPPAVIGGIAGFVAVRVIYDRRRRQAEAFETDRADVE